MTRQEVIDIARNLNRMRVAAQLDKRENERAIEWPDFERLPKATIIFQGHSDDKL